MGVNFRLIKASDVEEGDVIYSDELQFMEDNIKGKRNMGKYISERDRKIVGVRKELGSEMLVLHYVYVKADNKMYYKYVYPGDTDPKSKYKSSFIIGKHDMVPIILDLNRILKDL